ncbi:hypothetical protein V6N11_010595 [Hibiscus sabdariffa]|uniref:Uncharacterized protein n=1 Tax=Hibiscus sabdariffa TaxID=183260 RepID=A0ABR2S5Q9_9ROSI
MFPYLKDICDLLLYLSKIWEDNNTKTDFMELSHDSKVRTRVSWKLRIEITLTIAIGHIGYFASQEGVLGNYEELGSVNWPTVRKAKVEPVGAWYIFVEEILMLVETNDEAAPDLATLLTEIKKYGYEDIKKYNSEVMDIVDRFIVTMFDGLDEKC